MNNWEKEFDKAFTFTGIGHQLEGLALEQDLKQFIQTEVVEKIIKDFSTPYTMGCTNCRPTALKELKQLDAKWLGKE